METPGRAIRVVLVDPLVQKIMLGAESLGGKPRRVILTSRHVNEFWYVWDFVPGKR